MMNKMRKMKNKKGFTLMEMLIVVAIIAILVAIAIPTFASSLNKARVATDRESFILDFTSDEGVDFTGIKCSSSEVLGGIKLRMPYYEQKKMLNVDYGNAITCHKSQGSQYNDVIFVDEGFGSLCGWI